MILFFYGTGTGTNLTRNNTTKYFVNTNLLVPVSYRYRIGIVVLLQYIVIDSEIL